MLWQVRKWDIIIRNQRRVGQVGIDQVLDLAVVKKRDAGDLIVILHAHNDKTIVFGVGIGQRAYMFQKLRFSFLITYIDLPLFVIKAVLVVVREQVFYE